MKQPKILLWDIETSLIITTTFSLYPERIHHDNILQDWNIICGAWKELGKPEIHTAKVEEGPTDDFNLVQKLRDALADVDILIHHNGDKFDLKKLNARLIYYGLDPLPPIVTIDTLKEARKIASFTSNRLDYLGKFLCGEGKLHTEPGLWMEALKGNMVAVGKMLDYNKVDVEVLEKIYLKLRPYMKKHPHVGVMKEDNKCTCSHCGSKRVTKNGIRITAGGVKKQEVQCQDCGAYQRIATTLTLK